MGSRGVSKDMEGSAWGAWDQKCFIHTYHTDQHRRRCPCPCGGKAVSGTDLHSAHHDGAALLLLCPISALRVPPPPGQLLRRGGTSGCPQKGHTSLWPPVTATAGGIWAGEVGAGRRAGEGILTGAASQPGAHNRLQQSQEKCVGLCTPRGGWEGAEQLQEWSWDPSGAMLSVGQWLTYTSAGCSGKGSAPYW